MSELLIPSSATPIARHWLPCGVLSPSPSPTPLSTAFTPETLRGRELHSRQFQFPGRVIGLGSFSEISVVNHDDAVLDSDAVSQSLGFLALLNHFGRKYLFFVLPSNV